MNMLQCLSNGTIDFNNLTCYCGCGSGMGYFIIVAIVSFAALFASLFFVLINKWSKKL